MAEIISLRQPGLERGEPHATQYDTLPTGTSKFAMKIAVTILNGFEKHFSVYQEITAGAKQRFEQADWVGAREASRKRIHLYDKRVQETLAILRNDLHITELDTPFWEEVKIRYIRLLLNHRQPELAESFYNSVFCRLFDRRYYNNTNIFVRSSVSKEYILADEPIYKSYYPEKAGLQNTITQILNDAGLDIPFENIQRDVRNIMRTINRHLPLQRRVLQLNYQIDVLSSLFFRNKGAYLIGRVINGYHKTPFIVPILHNEKGGVYVDALLLDPVDLDAVFSFARAYFMVSTQVPSATVGFLMKILPDKSKSDLYSAIGFHKQGKTAFYRDFLFHLSHSNDEFIEAPGTRGLVMMVFTLPSYHYVFKLIKDRFEPPKDIPRSTVINKYLLVKQHDRVGRLADTMEYSDVALPKDRFSGELLEILETTCSRSVSIESDVVLLKHVYIEHRMVPLDLRLANVTDEEALKFTRGYGEAIKEMAAANIFPGDMLLKNFGVTRNNRVVFYDYDEISYLTDCKVRKIPKARNLDEEMFEQPWFSIGENDIFPEEFERYFLVNPAIRKYFREIHGDLMTPEFWRQKQEAIRAGELEDVVPYDPSIRFSREEKTNS